MSKVDIPAATKSEKGAGKGRCKGGGEKGGCEEEWGGLVGGVGGKRRGGMCEHN